ncbi:hypothetical protein GFY24_01980 [Nocardia sp. SYP-A9097]|uniref:hypothetical protein n=1 Tax=Nocardia sp. SYP-A9097 TaxID=2663237 RepID=UPI00129BC191|nr:hypothetical protein [Nocardia sp. SYP-A9097]MRH86246.1 hypothetical protein [Nocardia sp. SYP-A9097]
MCGHPLRGTLAAIAMTVLAVAAHGVAGGGYPDSAGLTLLLVAAAAIGAVAAVVRSPIALPALMALGQPVCHMALSGLAHPGHASGAMDFVNDGVMAAAHATAAVLFAVLILVAERLYALVSQAVRTALTRPAALLVPRGTGRWAAGSVMRGRLAPGANGSRAPPVAV